MGKERIHFSNFCRRKSKILLRTEEHHELKKDEKKCWKDWVRCPAPASRVSCGVELVAMAPWCELQEVTVVGRKAGATTPASGQWWSNKRRGRSSN
jgi:hypothetical protein